MRMTRTAPDTTRHRLCGGRAAVRDTQTLSVCLSVRPESPPRHRPHTALYVCSFQTTKSAIADPMLAIWGQQMFVNEDTTQ